MHGHHGTEQAWEAADPPWEAALERSMREHTGPIHAVAVHDGILLASGPPGEAKVSVWDVRGSQAAPRAATADSSITPGSADGLGPTDTPACSLAVPEGNCHSIEIQAGRIFLGGRPAAPPQPQALGWGQQAEEAMRAYAEAEAATYRAHPSWAMSIQADVAFM